MRLRTIELKNFGAYQATNIDLSQITAATISGPNGAGKSTAFIDAPLWALFGKCRMDTDKILRLGADEMTVAVGFLLNGQHYRVTRTRSLKTKAGKSELQLAIEQDGHWIPVSGARLADTQQKIIDLLRADFDLLTTTSFLVQGQAARFCQATPSERKAILAQILRLDQYAALKTGANRAGTIVATKREEKDKALAALSGTELVIDSLKREAATITERRQRITEAVAAADRERLALIEMQANDRAALDALQAIPEQLEKAKSRRQDIKAKEQTLLARRDRLEKILANRVMIEAKVEEEAQTRKRLDNLVEDERRLTLQIEEAAAKIRACQAEVGKGSELALKMNEARQSVAAAIRAYQDETRRLQQEQDTIQRQIDEAVRGYLLNSQELKAEIEQAKRDLDAAVDAYLRDTEAMRQTVLADEKAIELLGQVPCDSVLQGKCKFTLQAVEAQQRLQTSRPEEQARLTDRGQIAELVRPELVMVYRQNLKDEAARLTDPLAIADTIATSLFPDQQTLAQQIAARLTDEAAIALAVAPLDSATVRDLEGKLSAWHELQWEQKVAAATSEEQIAKAQRQTTITEQASARTALTKLAEFTVLVPELQAADRDLEQVNLDMAVVILDLAEVMASIEQGTAQLAERQTLTARLAQTDMDLQESDKKRAERTVADQGLAQQAGQLIERTQQAEQDLVTAAELRKELDVLAIEARQYQILTEAYTVIPILIMESAVPMLDQATNGMLAKLSTSGMQVRLETQKTLKSRDGLAEAMDIIVRDVFGERPYECYSGGERGRINLAIRIGLSKLLANRAGARLETLVVDEAYGEVDQEGVSQLVECLPVLTTEFPLLLFVSHDEAFKNALSQQIIVHKNGAGSTVEVCA